MTADKPADGIASRPDWQRRNSPLVYLYNGNILTMNPAEPRATQLMISGDRIWHCSDDVAPLGLNYRASGFATARKELKEHVQFIDLQGQTVLPGLVDAHIHFLWWAMNLEVADLSAARSEEECIEVLRTHAAGIRPGEWIRGFGWSHNLWDSFRLPVRSSLDAAFPNNPVHLSSKCGHLAWTNSAALQAAEVNDSTRNPAGGEIERREGRATGILKETAICLVSDRIGPPGEEQRLRALRRGQQLAHSLGLTGMQTPEDLDTWGFLQRARAADELSMRINFWIPAAAFDHLEGIQAQCGLGDERLRISAVKLFSDGSLGGRTALMYEPYEGEPENFGICVSDREEIHRITLRANRAGLPMAIHAIGDKAVDNVLAAYEASAEELGASGAAGVWPNVRNRIEHLQVYSDRDLERIRKLKPVASMQPIHLCADMGPAEKFWGTRSRNAYAFRTLAEAGCTLAFGSDAPVESLNPWYGLYAAITRCNMEGEPAGGWNREEKIGLQQALECYTVNCAAASGQAELLGTLSAGKLADFIVLPEDPFSLSPESLREMKPVATYSGANCVHAQPDWAAEG